MKTATTMVGWFSDCTYSKSTCGANNYKCTVFKHFQNWHFKIFDRIGAPTCRRPAHLNDLLTAHKSFQYVTNT